MNFVFISPNYPDSYWMFCRGLKKYGAKVLAIVDQPYDTLRSELKEYCDEIYVVNNFHNYDEMYRAVAYFCFKYGKVDWIESNNEAWLQLDAQLREDFNLTSGFDLETISKYQSKSGMKEFYAKAGVPTARYQLVDSFESAQSFAKEVGYPVVMKPDQGVGASFTYEIHDDKELKRVYQLTDYYTMIIEEYVDGDIFTMDGIVNRDGKIVYLSSLDYVGNPMESVSKQLSIGSFTCFTIQDAQKEMAQRVVDAFGLKDRFFHGEYFCLKEDGYLGKKGDVVGLELNFRPPGGFIPDLMNYAGNLDVYELWAEVLLTGKASYSKLKRFSAAFAGRRFNIKYKYSAQEMQKEFEQEWIDTQYLPPAFAAAMGDEIFIAKFSDKKTRETFFKKAFEVQKRKIKRDSKV